MAEFRKWTLHFDDGNNLIDGKRVQDPPGFAAGGGGKELVSACRIVVQCCMCFSVALAETPWQRHMNISARNRLASVCRSLLAQPVNT